jgi:hypothetical protein
MERIDFAQLGSVNGRRAAVAIWLQTARFKSLSPRHHPRSTAFQSAFGLSCRRAVRCKQPERIAVRPAGAILGNAPLAQQSVRAQASKKRLAGASFFFCFVFFIFFFFFFYFCFLCFLFFFVTVR